MSRSIQEILYCHNQIRGFGPSSTLTFSPQTVANDKGCIFRDKRYVKLHVFARLCPQESNLQCASVFKGNNGRQLPVHKQLCEFVRNLHQSTSGHYSESATYNFHTYHPARPPKQDLVEALLLPKLEIKEKRNTSC